MRVLFVLDSMNRAGAEIQALDVARKAEDAGIELFVAATGTGDMTPDFERSGAPFTQFNRRLPIDPRVVTGLRRLIKENGIDLVHAHQAVEGVHAYLATLGTSVKRVFTFHGHFQDLKNRLAISFLVPRMDANISCSEGLTAWLSQQNVDISQNFSLLYCGVDRDRLGYEGRALKEELGLSDSALLFGMVAHFHPARRKDHLTVCRAFARIANEIPSAHLVFAGRVVEGAEAKYQDCVTLCEAQGISGRVHFLGQRSDVAKIVDGIDIHVFSSFHEGLPIALMEAMLLRKPVIVSDIDPHMEATSNGEHGLTFRTGDAEDLAEKMLLLSTDEMKRASLASGAFEYADRTFNIESHLTNLKTLYERILSE